MQSKIFFILVFFLLPGINLKSQSALLSDQDTTKKNQGHWVYATIDENGDTLPHIIMNPYFVWARRDFASKKEEKKYNRLQKNVMTVYPYAKKASQLLAKYEKEMDTITDKKVIKKYYKKVEDELWEEYGDELKNLTVSQGRILIKLIDRETNRTSYELVQELRSGFTAFVFQGMARLFGHDLKAEYNASSEDKYIEEIVLAIEMNRI